MATEMGLPENEDLRRRAMARLGVAALVTAAALGGLWWLDHSSTQKESAPAPMSKPVVSAAPSEPPPVPAEAGESPETLPSSAVEAPLEPPPAPRVVSPSPAPVSVSPPVVVAPAMPTKASGPAVPLAPIGQAPVSVPTPVTAASGYVLQLGVFNNVERATDLVEQLRKQGIQAQIETRVQVGPYLNRSEAEKAAAEFKKRGLSALLIPPTPRK